MYGVHGSIFREKAGHHRYAIDLTSMGWGACLVWRKTSHDALEVAQFLPQYFPVDSSTAQPICIAGRGHLGCQSSRLKPFTPATINQNTTSTFNSKSISSLSDRNYRTYTPLLSALFARGPNKFWSDTLLIDCGHYASTH